MCTEEKLENTINEKVYWECNLKKESWTNTFWTFSASFLFFNVFYLFFKWKGEGQLEQ